MKLILQIALGYLVGKAVELTFTYFFAYDFMMKMANHQIQTQLGM